MPEIPNILVVDDDASIRDYLDSLLTLDGYKVMTASGGVDALTCFDNGKVPDVVILDIMMPGMDGIETLGHLKKRDPELPVIILSGLGQTATVVKAMKAGACDYIDKSFEADELQLAVQKALERRKLVEEIRKLRNRLRQREEVDPIVGSSKKVQAVRELVDNIADTDVTVLVDGESGVGKELVAKRLHRNSSRRSNKCVKVNCAALPPDLLESELFGYEKGAFTGALKQKTGKFEYANGGTIFLDEIGEMSLGLQAKLLQVIQDREFCRVGGNHTVQVNVRIVCATNRDLKKAVENNEFREDLFYRLNVINIRVPPLRERREDIPLLTKYFLNIYCEKYGRDVIQISDQLMKRFMNAHWAGNVRELENLIKRLVILGNEKFIFNEFRIGDGDDEAQGNDALGSGEDDADFIEDFCDLDIENGTVSLKEIAKRASMQAERRMISAVLRQTEWNRKKAARILDVSYKTLLNKIRECGLDRRGSLKL